MPNDNSTTNHFSFLSGGGEMGQLMRAKDWSATPVGSPDGWPQSLRTSLSIIIHSKFPMFLFWGPDHICFYNDAYRPSLGLNGKHPQCLGMKGKEVWPEIWENISPLITQVLQGGEGTWAEDQLLPIYRNGKLEDVYWTFSYSPVSDEGGNIAGVFVTCTETTSKINAYNNLQESMDFLKFATESSELGTWDYNPQTNRLSANNRLKEWFGFTHITDITIEQAITVIHQKDRDRAMMAIKNALEYASGGYYNIEYSIINPVNKKEMIVHAKGRAWFNEDKIAYRFNGIMQDVTQQVLASRALRQSEEKFRQTIEQAPLGITILRGPDYLVEMANSTYLNIINKTAHEFVGKPLFASWPQVKEAVDDILKSVLETGIPYRGTEFPVYIKHEEEYVQTYFNFVYQPLKENDGTIDGIIVIASDVTESVLARHQLAESERRFRNMVMQSPIPMTILRGKDYVIETANEVMVKAVWRRQEWEVIGKPILDAFPELMEQKYPELLNSVFSTGITYTETESLAFIKGNDGMKKFYLDFEYAPLLDPEQNISGIIITVNDVTEKVEARLAAEESKEKLNLVIEASELGTWELDMQTDEMNYSERFVQMFGFDAASQVTHEQLLKRIHPDDLPVRNAAFQKAFKTGVLHYEARILWANGIQRWMEAKGKISLDENGKPISLIGTTRDTTDEKYHQQEMENRERKFRLLADSMPQLVWTASAYGDINYFNQSVYNFSGLNELELLKHGWLQMLHPDDKADSKKAWDFAVESGNDFIFEHRFARADGEYRWQLSRAIPQKDLLGDIRMWVGTSTDIQEIKELDEQKNLFIGIASHELKTPITTVKGYVQLLQDMYMESDDIFLKNSLHKIHKQIETLTDLISDLLDLSKIKAGSLHYNKEDFNISELVEEVVSNTRHIYPQHQIEFTREINAFVHGDKNRIEQVLINFLTNAVKYSPDSKNVSVNIKQKNGNAVVSVTDNGIGIIKADQEKIFERFYRVEGKNEKTFPGFGIGLFISAEIIKKHGGQIGVDSEQGKGSTFYFSIPLLKH